MDVILASSSDFVGAVSVCYT